MFGFTLILGLVMLFTLVETYKSLSNVLIAFGSLGTASGLIMLLYALLYVDGAVFDVKGITIKKGNKEVFIDYSDIINLEYEKPSIIKYILFITGNLWPGTLRVNCDNQEGKSKAYFIRIKRKDFMILPKKYIDLIQ